MSGGVKFLSLKAWTRPVLETLTWLLLIFVMGSGIFWVFTWLSMTSAQGPRGLDMIGAVMGAVITAINGIPLAIMLKYLRGEKVKGALHKGVEPRTQPYGGSADAPPPPVS